jgi:hypothetical protein
MFFGNFIYLTYGRGGAAAAVRFVKTVGGSAGMIWSSTVFCILLQA